jgi:5-methylcytosine-specific restriction endonuclease McrA
VRLISETQTEIRFTADQELFEMLRQIQSLASHGNIQPGYNGLFKFMAAEVLKNLNPANQKTPRALSPVKAAKQHASSVATRYIPVPLKRLIWRRDHGRCTYVSPVTGRHCDSTHGLQFDHIRAWAKGGETSAVNLRLLCASHNRFVALEEYGERKMLPYLERGSG